MKKVKLSDGREITVKEPTVKMMKAAMKCESDMEQTAALISQTTDISEDELDAMSIIDFMRLKGATDIFLAEAGILVPQTK